MTERLVALLGCVQGRVSQDGSTGAARIEQTRFIEHVVIPLPTHGSHLVSLVCKYCEQTVGIRVRSLPTIHKKRLMARGAMAAAVCLWSAAAALLLVYFLASYPLPPGREVVLAGVLITVGVALWVLVDGYNAFAGDLKIGCQIEGSPEANRWSKKVSREGLMSLPSHVLLDPETEPVKGLAGAGPARELRKPTGRTAVAASGSLREAGDGPTSGVA